MKNLDQQLLAYEGAVQTHMAAAQEKMRNGHCFAASRELRLAAKAVEKVGDLRALLTDVLKRA